MESFLDQVLAYTLNFVLVIVAVCAAAAGLVLLIRKKVKAKKLRY